MKVNINDLKREHNEAMEEGRSLYPRIEQLHGRMMDIQAQLAAAEGDGYDPIPLIFGDGFYISPDDEGKEVEIAW